MYEPWEQRQRHSVHDAGDSRTQNVQRKSVDDGDLQVSCNNIVCLCIVIFANKYEFAFLAFRNAYTK